MASFNRRSFLKTSAAAAGIAGFPTILLAQNGETSPNKRLNVACIGCGGKGGGDMAEAAEGNNIVAVCDVDDRSTARAVKQHPGAKSFRDFRKMLDEMGNQIDAVTVSTPDHTHFPAALAAMQLGKHVCVQKPLANTIWEARQLKAAAHKYKVVTQMGIQGHTNEGMRLLREWIEAGAIGSVKEIIYWTNRPIWPQGIIPTRAATCPDYLDWNLWLSTTPDIPYFEYALEGADVKRGPGPHPFNWRAFWNYGCGALGDIGCHAMDAGFWSLDLGFPESIEAQTTEFDEATAPKQSTLTYQFGATDKRGPVKVSWYDGGRMPPKPAELGEGRELNSEWGQLFVGDKGTIYVNDAYCASPRLIPEQAMKDFKRPDKKYDRSVTPGRPQAEWVHCIKNGLTPGANFDYAAALTEMVLLGNLAIRSGKKVEWDAVNMKVKGNPDADRFIKRAYRQGWEPTPVV